MIPERLVQAYASAPQLANEESPFGLGTFDQFGFTFRIARFTDKWFETRIRAAQ